MDYMVILPTLNEREALTRCLTSSSRWGLLLERILAVDGSSTNDTAKEETGAVVVRHPRNMGYGAAVKTLMRAALAADAKYAVLLDADGQHDPADIPKFLQALKSGADHAAGNRFPHTKMSTIRRLGYKALALLHRILIAKTLAILLEIIATLLIAIAITSTTARKQTICHILHGEN
jgi:glycosyltransferase involved in cell wall biosynthesis